MTSTTPRNRHFLDSLIGSGSDAVPYGFAFSGLLLGAGAVITDSPVVGACGAVAGVAVGLLSQYRAKQYRAQAVALRERLRLQRSQADTANTELRSRLSALEIAVWEVKTLAAAPVVAQPAVEVVRPVVPEPLVVEVPARAGLRLAQAAARITVPKTVLDAAVATTGSISLAEIARAAQKKQAQVDAKADEKVDAVSAA